MPFSLDPPPAERYYIDGARWLSRLPVNGLFSLISFIRFILSRQQVCSPEAACGLFARRAHHYWNARSMNEVCCG
jgi:hypothetical protein